MSERKLSVSKRKDALSLAQGLFESKVLVERPPTSSQKTTYHTVRSGSTLRPGATRGGWTRRKHHPRPPVVQAWQVNPVWKPFTGGKSLSRITTSDFAAQTTNNHNDVPSTQILNTTEIQDSNQPRLPKSVSLFECWINEDCCEEWTGIVSHPNCFPLLPCGYDDNILDYLPPLQSSDEQLLPRPEPKKYVAPKILHNYNYLENQNDYDHQCQHDEKLPVKVDQSPEIPRLRTCEIIKQEIEDLERLLQGYGNPNSSSIVNRYQHEITTLKQMVVDTLRDYNITTTTRSNVGLTQDAQEVTDDDVIQGDLFEFLSRHEEIITAIKEKRDGCIKELARLEKELLLAEGDR